MGKGRKEKEEKMEKEEKKEKNEEKRKKEKREKRKERKGKGGEKEREEERKEKGRKRELKKKRKEKKKENFASSITSRSAHNYGKNPGADKWPSVSPRTRQRPVTLAVEGKGHCCCVQETPNPPDSVFFFRPVPFSIVVPRREGTR